MNSPATHQWVHVRRVQILFFCVCLCARASFSLITHAEHGEPNAGLGHDEHGALDDARRLDVPPASRTHQETANQNNETLLLLLLLEC